MVTSSRHEFGMSVLEAHADRLHVRNLNGRRTCPTGSELLIMGESSAEVPSLQVTPLPGWNIM